MFQSKVKLSHETNTLTFSIIYELHICRHSHHFILHLEINENVTRNLKKNCYQHEKYQSKCDVTKLNCRYIFVFRTILSDWELEYAWQSPVRYGCSTPCISFWNSSPVGGELATLCICFSTQFIIDFYLNIIDFSF